MQVLIPALTLGRQAVREALEIRHFLAERAADQAVLVAVPVELRVPQALVSLGV